MSGYGAQIAAKAWDGDGVPVEDSNVAGIGSEEDMAARKNAAMTEPAWKGAGTAPGLWVWRIENFEVKPWPKEKYGQFYKGDSYIVLATEKKDDSDALIHQIHFWLGKDTSIDEQGTAAYKTVELDDYFDGAPTQHREVMGSESDQFLNLFEKMTYLDGGIASGFNSSAPDTYEAKLLRVHRRVKNNKILVWEVPCKLASLNQSDSFILDAGTTIYKYQGDKASNFEKFAAATAAENIEGERGGKSTATEDLDDAFWEKLGGKGDIKESDEDGKKEYRRRDATLEHKAVLFRLSDESGSLKCVEVASGDLTKDMLKSEDVMMLDEGHAVCLWVGKGASAAEKKNALRIAMRFLKTNDKPANTPIHIFKEGKPIKNDNWRHTFHN